MVRVENSSVRCVDVCGAGGLEAGVRAQCPVCAVVVGGCRQDARGRNATLHWTLTGKEVSNRILVYWSTGHWGV